MTIAACYLSSEGIVLGADSTASWLVDSGGGLSGYHYFNHNQKIFELGENATVGVLTWGLGSLGPKSYRTLLASLSDDLQKNAPSKGVAEVADRWCTNFWQEYQTDLKPAIQRCNDLNAKAAYMASPATPAPVPGPAPSAGTAPTLAATVVPAAPAMRTEAEEREFRTLKTGLVAGFCVAGYWLPDRTTTAFELIFDPLAPKPTPKQIPTLHYGFWGAHNLMKRLIWGGDDSLRADILASGKWSGNPAELDKVFEKQRLGHAILPIRDAVDFVHTCIYSTIKALKFSSLPQICGGPIELAVITSDRRFRWVRHKTWDSALLEI
jgi:hypothetical protein